MIYYVLDSAGKEPACQCRRCKRYGSRRSPGKGNGNPLAYSCLENSMNGGVWQGHKKSPELRTQKQN